MKIRKILVSIFLFTFFLGIIAYFLIPKMENKIDPKEITEVTSEKIPTPMVEKNIESEILEENVDWKEEDETKFKIKILETGEEFHGDQVTAKNGEIWFGLFEESGRYFLRSTKLKISRVHDGIVDEENERTGKSVSVKGKSQPIILLKNAKMLKEGQVKSVYYVNNEEGIKNGFNKTFKFNNENYNLRVENKLSSEEYLGKGSKLILTHNGKEQVLNYLKDGCNDCFWYLYWVGDLDQDGKLDFYMDLSWHYNVMDRKLFLSSQAENGKLVKYVANFWTNGC